MKTYLTVLLLLTIINFNIFAQSGPVSPCVNCETLNKRTEPYNGLWYNPEQSGTGFSIEVQNGVLFGAYYGYDEQGKQLWLTFLGDLVPSDEVNVMWTVDADLQKFENGNAFNQNYVNPELTDYLGQISIKFTQKNHATFRVNAGEEQNIVPIIFGVKSSADFPQQTSYKFPNLEGVWTLTYHYKSSSSLNDVPFVPPEPFSIRSESVVISEKRIVDIDNDGDDEVVYYILSFFFYPETLIVGSIICDTSTDNEQEIGPSCELIDDRGLFGDINNKPHYKFSIGGLGAFNIFGEHEDEHTVELIKIN